MTRLRGLYKLDAKHRVVACRDAEAWAYWFSTHAKQRSIGRTEVGEYLISTVFVGIDFDFDPHHSPQVFETMVFDKRGNIASMLPAGQGGLLATYQRRCATWTEAVAMHQRAVEEFTPAPRKTTPRR